MAIARGTRFGSYEVAALVGVGGMGEVYRARDTELKRDVALKVLPAELANNAERLARLKREAEMLAALNHTNIAQIHGLERGDGQTALVMEFVEGQTLAERITLGPILPEEALGIAMQIADGLEAAHARGIVHRDLKPANVKLTADGIVKLLDFGIAKALDTRATSGSQAPQLTTPAMTEAGVVLGTAAYMSPEQARGKPVDERADIWAFGCVLYEMLTGQPAFGGEDVTDTLARVLERHADFGLLPKTVPPAVRRTLDLCLEKDLRRRIADIRDVKLALDGRFEEQGARAVGSRPAPTAWRRALLLVAALAAGFAAWSIWPKPEPKPVKRFVHALPEGQEFTGLFHVMDLAPDGSALVYSGVGGLRLREMAALEERAIGGADGLLSAQTFSPDGQSIAYLLPTGIHRLPVGGGPAARVSERVLLGPFALHWAPDGTIFFSDIGGIYRVPASGGTPERIVDAEGQVVFGPQLLPDGDTLLFTRNSVSATPAQAQVIAQSLATGERTVIVDRGVDARYVPTGHIVYALEDTLFGVAFDLQTKRVIGGAVPLVQGVAANLWAQFAIANDGTLAYVRGLGADQNPRVLVWVDREGRETALPAPARNYIYVDLSPDEKRLALDIRDQESDVWVFDFAREDLQRFTLDPGRNRGVVWSADSARIAFSRELGATEEIYWQAADGSGVPVPLTQDSGMAITPWDITADGRLLFATSALPRDIFMIPVAGPAGPGTPLLDGPASEGSPTVSPDGRWLAYSSDEYGPYQVYVRPFPDVDSGHWEISTAGGIHPHWSSDGSELFYLEVRGADEVAMMAVAVESGETFRRSVPVALFQGRYHFAAEFGGPDTYDVSADGQRFLMIAESRAAGTDNVRPDIVIVQNWFEELKRLVPTE